MPHEKGRLSPVTDAGAVTVTVDHRKALTITTAGKLDNLQTGNPLKIHKRKGLFDECVDADVAKSGRKHPKVRKIHWTQLAANGASSVSAHRHNGRQTDEHDRNNSTMSEIKSRQVKVTLMDVFQTEEGQRYLSSCGSDTDAERQSSRKRGPRQRRSERGPSTVRRRARALRKDQTETTDTEGSERDLSERVRCTERFGGSPKQSDEEESRSPGEGRHNLSPKHTDAADNELCPVEESDSSRPTSVSPVQSEEADSEQISESLIAATRTPSQAKQPSGFDRTEYRDSESDAVPTQQKTSANEARECAGITGEEEGEIEQEREEEEALQQNGEVLDEGGGARGSVLRLSTGAAEGQLADEEVTPSSSQMPGSAHKHVGDLQPVEVRQAAKPQTIEPIVLSSEEEEVQEEEEEEEEDGGTLHVQALEGAVDPRRPQKPVSSFGDSVLSGCSVMELQFSALYMGSLSALTNGLVKITDDTITISCKEPSGAGVKTSLATEHVRKYSVWDGLLVQDSRIAKEHEVPPPSVLLIWLDEAQARRLSSDLSVLLPGTRPAEGSTCVVLCVSEPLNGVQGALLASIMDIVGLRHGNTELLTPHTHPDSLKILQNSPDSHMLQLLLPAASCESESKTAPAPAPAPASATAASAKDADAQPDSSVYTLCQSRGQSAYRVSLAHKPGADWTQYRHCGPARRLIQFPPPPSKGAITVTTEDLECLDSGEFLNDVIIDFYLKYLLVKKAPHASVRRSHVFSSFFYKQLTRRDNANEDSISTPAQLRRHQRVRTWTRHVDIFEKDFLFVPVNQEAHWYLVVVCFPGLDEPHYVERGDHASAHVETENADDTTAQSESQHGDGDTNSGENSSRSVSALAPPTCTENTCKRRTVCKRPCILIMDSLKVSIHERVFKLLREYLQAEWEVKRGGHRDFSAERMVGSHCRVPLQDNSSDCGLYLLQYAESFLQDPVVHFDLPLKLECWFPRQKVREKREEIRDLVLHLYRFQQGSLGNDSSDDGKEIGNIV
ncbi:sentrin-specific protease 7 isoform X3 [Ictalurus furcatus]|uniref:sentrin-specific protease 7 isoform X3 n=1 Tax=Ictalurus furcatus TaxID=66913 RepID=UPI0023505AA9|nr:sentrin-specific protease 7 isoform X3 [Ictalurus furcatus]